ncbi:MAG TPA: glycosyltransferase [Ignavibacteriaceae bacterium]|nr:glycosyltransferase [Ignavibacteriaceae bacterium]
MILFWIITVSLVFILLVSIYNLITAPVASSSIFNNETKPFVSVLIPARNEENNIGECLNHLVAQDYNNLEILVLDDHSTDKTGKIVEGYREKQIKLIKGKDFPESWLGKNWACHQLSNEAKGKYLLFLDADVRIEKETISSILAEMNNAKVKLISVFSTQIIKSFGEWMIVPLMNWLLLAFLPLRLVYSSSNKSFVAANGQFMFWERETYFKIGGHKAVKDKVVEDMEFARICKSRNIKIKTMLGGNLIFCQMYNGFSNAKKGFSKNFYPGFSVNSFVFLMMITFFIVIFFLPFALLFYSTLYIIPVLLIVSIRVFISKISKQNIAFNVILHPLQMLFMFFIGINSVISSNTGKIEWKGRRF